MHHKASQASGRHRRDGGRPSGNSRGRSVKRGPKARTHPQSFGQASHRTAISGLPCWYMKMASSPERTCGAASTPTARNSHPTRLRRRRETARAPITVHELKSTITDKLEPIESELITTSAAPAASMASPAAASDQASRDTVRVLISLSRDCRWDAAHHSRLAPSGDVHVDPPMLV